MVDVRRAPTARPARGPRRRKMRLKSSRPGCFPRWPRGGAALRARRVPRASSGLGGDAPERTRARCRASGRTAPLRFEAGQVAVVREGLGARAVCDDGCEALVLGPTSTSTSAPVERRRVHRSAPVDVPSPAEERRSRRRRPPPSPSRTRSGCLRSRRARARRRAGRRSRAGRGAARDGPHPCGHRPRRARRSPPPIPRCRVPPDRRSPSEDSKATGRYAPLGGRRSPPAACASERRRCSSAQEQNEREHAGADDRRRRG